MWLFIALRTAVGHWVHNGAPLGSIGPWDFLRSQPLSQPLSGQAGSQESLNEEQVVMPSNLIAMPRKLEGN